MRIGDLLAEAMIDAHRARLGVYIYCGHHETHHHENHEYWDGKNNT